MRFVMHYHMLAIEDQHGNGWTGVVNDMGDVIQVYGLRDASGKPFLFESEAYHLPSSCNESGLFYYSKEVSDEVEFE